MGLDGTGKDPVPGILPNGLGPACEKLSRKRATEKYSPPSLFGFIRK